MSRRPLVAPALALGTLLLAAPGAARAQSLLGEPIYRDAAPPAAAPSDAGNATVRDAAAPRLFGRSGKLRAAMAQTTDLLAFPFLAGLAGEATPRRSWVPLFAGGGAGLLGTPTRSSPMRAPAAPGIWRLESERAYAAAGTAPEAFELITRVPFASKRNGYVNGYHVGRYPTEGTGRRDRYAPPEGFIEVTRENQDFQISEHFRLRQFLTKDQFDVWPKYLVLDLRLIDKLELVLQELNEMGVRADRLHVMSGYRTPQYNGPGGDGRATLSRHMHGDAADVWVDNDGDGYIDDLNGDGRRDMHDTRVILKAVERVEAKYPELVGGAGIYPDNGAHGPFIHIDARGVRSRW